MTNTRARLRAAVTVARALVSSLSARRTPAGSGDHTVPDSIAAYDHTLTAGIEIAAPPAEVFALATDFSRYDEWLTVHGGWRDGAPAQPELSASFVQKTKIMGMPIDVRWTVTDLTDTSIELTGTGPMGALVGLSYQVEPSTRGTTVWVDCGLGGDPLKGPMGTSAARSFSSELDTSLRKLAELLGGATTPTAASAPTQDVKPLSVLRPEGGEPVRHHSGALLDPRTPVIVGVGQVVHRPTSDGELPDPATLAGQALRKAAEDSGAGERLLSTADSVRAVSSASWAYNDQARLVADAVGASPRETVASARFGGDGSQRLVNDSAQSIADGLADVVLISGAESGASIVEAQRRGGSPDWPEQPNDVAPRRVIGTEREANNDAETAVGLMAPIYVYALLENAVRARFGTTPEAHLREIADLWARFSAVAARNPYAWQPQSFTTDELMSTSDTNRPVSSPYPKLLTANLQVDLASGVIMCSAAAAQEAGIPSERWVFPHAGAHAEDEWFVSERAELAASPAINAIGRAALDHTGLSIEDFKHIDLYSCFPSAVQIAARELDLCPAYADRPLTVTGGLTFAGGPGNNYTGHSLATMVGILRDNPDDYGLTTGLGWYATKHAIGVYSATPPRQAFRQIDAEPLVQRPQPRPVVHQHTGPAVVESYTVPYTRDGAPEAVIISALTRDGNRVLVRSKDPEVVDVMATSDPLGWTIDVDGPDTCRVVDRMPAPLPAPPPPPVQVERANGVHVITLNRPRARNAINLATAKALERALDAFEADDDARVAVLTGAGGTFCSGMDLKAAAKGEYPLTEGRGPLGMTQRPPSKPVIAAVEGYAHAGGFELALASDLIVAAEDAEFGIPEPKRGLVAAAGGLLRLSERLPRNSALELALTADPLPARRLYELGLVNRLVKRGSAREVALELAATIAANAPLAIEASKRIIDERGAWRGDEAWDKQTDVASVALFSEDATEGVRAFAEGRDPVWRGR